eukprot:403362314
MLQDLFFKFAEGRNSLPDQCGQTVIDSFLAILVSIISFNQYQKTAVRALKILFEFLKNDTQVYSRFKPNKIIIRKMNIASIIQSQREEDSDMGLDFASFLLRYHRDLDYSDFSDDPICTHKIKRAETYRSWADIEDLANGFESLSSNIEQHQTTAANAFQELYNYIEKTKKELHSKDDETRAEILYVKDDVRRLVGIYNPEKDEVLKDFGKARIQVSDFLGEKVKNLETQIEEKLLKRIEALEQGLILNLAAHANNAPKINIITGGAQQNPMASDQVAQQLAQIKTQQNSNTSQQRQMNEQNQMKLEESLRDHVEILQTLNAKLNNHIQQMNDQRIFTNERFDKLEKVGLNKEIESIPARYDLIQYEQTLKKIISDVDSIRNDQLASKELENIKSQEIDAFFKKTANDYFTKLRAVEDEVRLLRDEKSIFRMDNKISILEQEVVDLKNVRKNNVRSHQLINITPDYTEKFDILVDEVNQLWSFLQRFIDEQVVDAITVVKSPDHAFKEKMNEMDWLSRNAEFLSPDSITKQHTKMLNRDDETMSRLAILISILEPLLINDMNLEKALNTNAVELLLSLLYLPEEFKNIVEFDNEMKKRFPIYLKYTLRCLTSCIRSPLGVAQFMKVSTSISQVLEFLEKVKDEEILANSAKIIRITLRDDKWYDKISGQHSDLGNTLLRSIETYSFSEVVIIELLAAVRNFTRVSSKVVFIAKNCINPIVTLAIQPPNEKIYSLAVQCLRNLMKVPDFDRHIKQVGGHEIVLVMGEANKFAFKQ